VSADRGAGSGAGGSAAPARTLRLYVELGPPPAPSLLRWSTWGQTPSNFDSYALLGPGGAVLIDPAVLPEGAPPDGGPAHDLWARLGAPPVATVLTNDMHERDAYAVRERFGAPVWAPAAGLPERGGVLEATPDHAYEDGETLPGGLRAHRIAGKFAGDTVLLWTAPAGEAVLFTGDALNGRLNPENPLPHPRRGAPGLYVGAGSPYLRDLDVEALKRSLRPLLAGRIDLICGAHGLPWRDDPQGALARLLDLDWTPFLRDGRHPVVS
jgi:hypothetical protein